MLHNANVHQAPMMGIHTIQLMDVRQCHVSTILTVHPRNFAIDLPIRAMMYVMKILVVIMQFVSQRITMQYANALRAILVIQYPNSVVSKVLHVMDVQKQQYVKLDQMDHIVDVHLDKLVTQKLQDAMQSERVLMVIVIVPKQHLVFKEDALINVTKHVAQIWHVNTKTIKQFVYVRTGLSLFQMKLKMDVFEIHQLVDLIWNVMVVYVSMVNVLLLVETKTIALKMKNVLTVFVLFAAPATANVRLIKHAVREPVL